MRKCLKDCQAEFTTFLKQYIAPRRPLRSAAVAVPLFQSQCLSVAPSVRPAAQAVFQTSAQRIQVRVGDSQQELDQLGFSRNAARPSVAFALVAQAWMPRIDTLAKALDLLTSDFVYVALHRRPKSHRSQNQTLGQVDRRQDSGDEGVDRRTQRKSPTRASRPTRFSTTTTPASLRVGQAIRRLWTRRVSRI